ncbi:hypothetical protein O3P69_008670 [Scylla paramamosain]|uniref:Uncharacterized protein n=1 Tax=Scylla paramamosain TaxID=85552 RepID=A0AAW0SN04_SCYPA
MAKQTKDEGTLRGESDSRLSASCEVCNTITGIEQNSRSLASADPGLVGVDMRSPLPFPLSTRCCLFCMPWLVTGYMHVYSLWIFDCTDVMALYSAHVSFVFLLSWVILHDQFVGVRAPFLSLQFNHMFFPSHFPPFLSATFPSRAPFLSFLSSCLPQILSPFPHAAEG